MAMGCARLCAIQNKTICTPIASAMYVSLFLSRARVLFKRVLPVLQNLYRSDDNCKSLKPLFIGLFVAIAVVVATTMLGIVVKRRYAQPALVNNQVCRPGAVGRSLFDLRLTRPSVCRPRWPGRAAK